MHIATVLFTYKRLKHTQHVLDALKNNTIHPEKLFIFQDGYRDEQDREEWEKVSQIIEEVDWCEKEVIISKINKGLSNAITTGISYILEKYDAVVVLEDDCITAPTFMDFMNQCLYKYEKEKKVYSVSGYSWPLEFKKNNDYDIYFSGRISSWGWGTWKDRWGAYEEDYDILKKINQDKDASERKAIWGNDLEQILIGNISGITNSWAVFWMAKVILEGGYCVNPYENLILNEGFDGTGRHCRFENTANKELCTAESIIYRLPDNIEYNKECSSKFNQLFAGIDFNKEDSDYLPHTVIWGLGKVLEKYREQINAEYIIDYFIDSYRNGFYAGRKIVKPSEVQNDISHVIVLIQDLNICFWAVNQLINQGIEPHKIEIGVIKYGEYKNITNLTIISKNEFTLHYADLKIKFSSVDQFYNIYEVFSQKCYQYTINNDKKDIVIDVGMNIGDSTLFFLNQKNVEKVYGYEPFKDTYKYAVTNMEKIKKEYEINEYGISNCNEERKIIFNRDMSCGMSSNIYSNEIAQKIYEDGKYINGENNLETTIRVKKASVILQDIIMKHPDCNIVLKMDCEGEEYCILEDLDANGLLVKIDFIMLEWHYNGKEKIRKYLNKNKFSYFENDKTDKMGLIYAWRMEKI